MESSTDNRRIGIIGTGAIAEAVVTGLCSKADPPRGIVLSPRNKRRAARLAERFPNVQIASNNQAVIAESHIVFLAVRPQVVEDVLANLSFREDLLVVSLIAGCPITRLKTLVQPATTIVRMIPLPAIARREGPILMSPPMQEIAAIFKDMGTLIQLEQEDQLETLCAVTGLMAPYFGLLDKCVSWLTTNGINPSQAIEFVGALFAVLGSTPIRFTDQDFRQLAREHATPQGFNEQALRELAKAGWYRDVSDVLYLLRRRLCGEADFEDGIRR
ncbi:MAG: NAD(P)-binding domain-containing protein [Verrucomicrobiae bacterium]|nr:NAD(P)-binding domain-containing protein [Verrucomicrobiae bacterium]